MSLNGTYNLTSDPNDFESVVFRMRDDFKYNFDKHDPLIEDFVLIHSPMKFLSLITGILILLKTTERFMSTREAFSFARPAFLVNCGLTFGINGIGALICIAGKSNFLWQWLYLKVQVQWFSIMFIDWLIVNSSLSLLWWQQSRKEAIISLIALTDLISVCQPSSVDTWSLCTWQPSCMTFCLLSCLFFKSKKYPIISSFVNWYGLGLHMSSWNSIH